jgi:hypothetical protein
MYEPPRDRWREPKEPQRYMGMSAPAFDALVLGGIISLAAFLWVFVFDGWTPNTDDIRPQTLLGKDVDKDIAALQEGLAPAPAGDADAMQAAVDNSLLRLEDFPAAWGISSSPETMVLDLPDECSALESGPLPGQMAAGVSPTFTGPDNQEVVSTTAGMSDEGSAQQAVLSMRNLIGPCRAPLEQAMVSAVTQGLREEGAAVAAAVGSVNASLHDISFDAFGEETLSYRFAIEFVVDGARLDYASDLIFIRSGPFIGGLVYSAVVPDVEHERSLASVIAQRLSEATGTLP